MNFRHKRYQCPHCQSLRTMRPFQEIPKGYCEACQRPFDITPDMKSQKRASVQAHSWGYGSGPT